MVFSSEFQVATSNTAFAYSLAMFGKDEQPGWFKVKYWNIYISAYV